jgi:hypothetical protein
MLKTIRLATVAAILNHMCCLAIRAIEAALAPSGVHGTSSGRRQ